MWDPKQGGTDLVHETETLGDAEHGHNDPINLYPTVPPHQLNRSSPGKTELPLTPFCPAEEYR